MRKSTDRGHLMAESRARQNVTSSWKAPRCPRTPIDQLDNRLDLFAEVLVWNADHGRIQHCLVLEQEVFDLLRIDVHAAGDITNDLRSVRYR